MCEQCLVNPLFFGEFLPGHHLIRARRESDDMKVGDWGIVRCNNPDIVWNSNPKEEVDLWLDIPKDFMVAFETASVGFISSISIEAYKNGYDGVGDVQLFIWNRLVSFIKESNPTTWDDPFSHLDNTMQHDYTMGKG